MNTSQDRWKRELQHVCQSEACNPCRQSASQSLSSSLELEEELELEAPPSFADSSFLLSVKAATPAGTSAWPRAATKTAATAPNTKPENAFPASLRKSASFKPMGGVEMRNEKWEMRKTTRSHNLQSESTNRKSEAAKKYLKKVITAISGLRFCLPANAHNCTIVIIHASRQAN